MNCYEYTIYMPVSSSSKWPFDSLNAGQQQALNRLLVGPNGMGFDTEFCVLEFEIGSSVLEDPAVGHNSQGEPPGCLGNKFLGLTQGSLNGTYFGGIKVDAQQMIN